MTKTDRKLEWLPKALKQVLPNEWLRKIAVTSSGRLARPSTQHISWANLPLPLLYLNALIRKMRIMFACFMGTS